MPELDEEGGDGVENWWFSNWETEITSGVRTRSQSDTCGKSIASNKMRSLLFMLLLLLDS